MVAPVRSCISINYNRRELVFPLVATKKGSRWPPRGCLSGHQGEVKVATKGNPGWIVRDFLIIL